MGITVSSLLWAMQDLYHQPYNYYSLEYKKSIDNYFGPCIGVSFLT